MNIPLKANSSGKEKIWKDFHPKRIFWLTLMLILLVVFFVSLKDIFNSNNQYEIISGVFVIVLIFFFLFNLIRTDLSYITKNGIRLGNTKDDKYQSFKLQKSHFSTWNDIHSIKIKGRVVKRPTYADLIDVLEIKSKDNEKYECFIAQPQEFIKALKQLNKQHLLSKDSKYHELLK